jgi:hypothetical protein
MRNGFGFGMKAAPIARAPVEGGGGDPEPAWQMFLLTAGDVLGVYAGYVAAGALGNEEPIGDVGPEPHTVYIARGIIDAGPGEGYAVQIFGDCASELDNLVLEINGIQTVRMSPAVYIEADNYTTVQYNSETTERFVIDGAYVCQLVTPNPV